MVFFLLAVPGLGVGDSRKKIVKPDDRYLKGCKSHAQIGRYPAMAPKGNV